TGTYGEDKVQFTAAAAPTLSGHVGGGSLSAGAYKGLVPFVVDGLGSYGTASSPLTVSANDYLILTNIPTGRAGTTARKIYRTQAGGTTFLFDQTISDNLTVTVNSTQADAALGSVIFGNNGAAPATGDALTADLTARPRVGVRFANDDQLESFIQSS